MATPTKEMDELTWRRYEEFDRDEVIEEKYDNDEYIWQASWTHKCPTYTHRTPPCQGSCPSGHDIRGWLDIVRGLEKPTGDTSWQEYAFRRATKANPFPAIMGRVCPAPCEDGCNRNEVDDHVGINSVEQFMGDWALANNIKFTAGEETGKKVAIVGGGPGGLAAAYQLRLKGHGVTIFDEHSELGGMMRYGIPGYRTPRNVLDGEIQRIVDMGVEVKNNTRVGRDVSMSDLDAQFDSVVWAIGAQAGRPLPIDGADATNCITGVAFLEAFNEGRLQHVSGPIVVIGGGDTSIDVASVARRLGHISVENDKDRPEHIIINQVAHDVASTAKREGAEVMLISRQPLNKLNAAQHEIDDALAEGVDLRGGLSPVEVVVGEDGRATGLKVVELSYESGKAEAIEGTEKVLPADLVVAAIGQTGNLEGIEEIGNERGLVTADKHYQVASKPGHFVVGDAIMPHLLTTAIGHASVAAEGIDEYLNSQELNKRPKVDVHHFSLLNKLKEWGLEPDSETFGPTKEDGKRGTSEAKFAVHNYEDRGANEIIPQDQLFLGHFMPEDRNKRQMSQLDSESVLQNFEERMQGLDEETVVVEAKRCMSCGMCFECDNCIIYCPQEAVKRTPKSDTTTGRYVYTDYSKCVGCHICADVCPTGYIVMGMGE